MPYNHGHNRLKIDTVINFLLRRNGGGDETPSKLSFHPRQSADVVNNNYISL